MYWDAPAVAKRDCRSCKLWQYNEQTGLIDTFGGRPIRRRGKMPCEYATCAKGTYYSPRAWYPCNEQAFMHWMECRATGLFPDDPIVRRHAALLELALDLREQDRQHKFWAAVAARP